MFHRNLLAAAALAITAGASFAQAPVSPTTPVTNAAEAREEHRDANQQQRIQAGEANGSITRHEQRRLEKQQWRIHHAEKRAAADGTVTAGEAAHIEKMQDKASRNIYDQKRDAQGTVTTPKNR
jgi:hypothetical protein